ncbi:MAG: hypothetical protein ACXWCM_08320 [Acidimicrobiales bacterium]
MLVEVGPVPSASALAYIRFAREMLAELVTRHGKDSPSAWPEMAAEFETLFDRWEKIARSGPVFTWSWERDVEEVEYWFVAFVRLVLEADPLGRTSERVADDETELRRPFRVALVNGVLTALEREGGGSAALATELRSEWPDDDIR